MNDDSKKALRSLEAIVSDDNEMSVEELRADLAQQGVDVEKFLGRFGAVVRDGYQKRMRRLAEQGQERARVVSLSPFGDLANKTRAELERIVAQIHEGVFGSGLQQANFARARNQQGEQLSDTELRSWLEDIAAGSK